jgi:kumamolisin
MAEDRVALPGSDRQAAPNAQAIGPTDPDQQIEVTVLVKSRETDSRTTLAAMAGQSPQERKYLSREEFAQTHGAEQADLDQIAVWAESQALTVVETSVARRSVVLSGTVAAFTAAFGVTLTAQQAGGHTFRGRTGPVYLPASLAPIVQGVFGLDDRPQATSHARVRPAASTDISYTPPQVAQAYDFPTGTDGTGQTIGLIELGGGYRVKDLKAYFTKLGVPQPKVTAARVDGGSNKPTGDPNSADVEVMLDIEVAGGVAPGAQIVVYFTPNTDQGFLDAVTTAIHDTTHKPGVISISWGGPEANWTSQSLQAFDQAFADAATMGITICCASGDDGSSDGATDGLAHVDFPASSPHALSCGGTSLRATQAVITEETVWNDGAAGGAGGGGVSDVFPVPDYQSGAHVPVSANSDKRVGRGVPDVAGVADPATGYQIEVDSQQTVGGGTSAVAPLWAGLVARLNQALGKPVGFLNPLLYSTALTGGAFHDITAGDNGAYQAGPGWDACTGLGSPDGAKLLAVLKG